MLVWALAFSVNIFFMKYVGIGDFYFKIPHLALAFSVSGYPLLQLSLSSM